MKTNTSIKKVLLSICILFAVSTHSQTCTASLSVTDNGNASFYLHGNTNVPWSGGTNTYYSWDFGDGRSDYTYQGPNGVTQGNGNSNCPPSVTHQYIANGIFIVNFTAHLYNSANPSETCDASISDTIVVSGLPCNITPTIDVTQLDNFTYEFGGHIASGGTITQGTWT